jgi:hypothetical protein
MVPRPITGGGGKMAMKASWMAANFLVELRRRWPRPTARARLRSAKGFSVTKTMPALELLVKPLIDRPGKATALSTPGCLRAISPMRRITPRCGRARRRIRQLGEADQVLLVLRRHEAAGHEVEQATVTPSSTA